MKLLSIITCPHCGYAAVERMPPNVCQIFYDCKGCGARLKPKPGVLRKRQRIARVEIDKNGKIVVVTAKPEDAVNGEKLGENEWDGVTDSVKNHETPVHPPQRP
jgi:hypothetical protein